MALPSVRVGVKDGGIGVVAQNVDGVVAMVGVCSLGAVNVANSFSDLNALKAALGTGPLVEAAAAKLSISGGPVVCARVTGSVPGAFGAVALVGTGLSVLTLTGSVPVDAYEAQIKIVTGAANPASAAVVFTYSLDGGDTVSGLTALPASGIYVVPGSGVTLNFSAATLVAGDTYSFTTTAPGYNTTDLGLAIDAVFTSAQTFFLVQIVGTPANAAAMQAVFTLLDAKLTAAANGTLPGRFGRQMFARGAMSCIVDTTPNIQAAVSSLASTRASIAANDAETLSFVDATFQRRSTLTTMVAKASSLGAGTDVAKYNGGLVTGVTKLYNEDQVEALDNLRLCTLRTHPESPGFYVGNFWLKSPVGSDFKYLQHGRVMDLACRITSLALLKYLNDDLKLTKAGLLEESDTVKVENECTEAVVNGVVRERFASFANVTIDRNQNILLSERLVAQVAVTPLGYLKAIVAEVGFVNPRFAVA